MQNQEVVDLIRLSMMQLDQTFRLLQQALKAEMTPAPVVEASHGNPGNQPAADEKKPE